jgi:hypothetical protein
MQLLSHQDTNARKLFGTRSGFRVHARASPPLIQQRGRSFISYLI